MEATVREVVPDDHMPLARDRLLRLKQTTSVSKYSADFRNFALTNRDTTEGENADRSVHGLKPEIRLEVMKSQPISLEYAARM